MSNPTTLGELAANLAAVANQIRSTADKSLDTAYDAGFVDALLDTRTTVLAMISAGEQDRRRISDLGELMINGPREVTTGGEPGSLILRYNRPTDRDDALRALRAYRGEA